MPLAEGRRGDISLTSQATCCSFCEIGLEFGLTVAVPRKYAKSTSGLISSHITLPPEKRSMAMAISAPMFFPADMALRK